MKNPPNVVYMLVSVYLEYNNQRPARDWRLSHICTPRCSSFSFTILLLAVFLSTSSSDGAPRPPLYLSAVVLKHHVCLLLLLPPPIVRLRFFLLLDPLEYSRRRRL